MCGVEFWSFFFKWFFYLLVANFSLHSMFVSLAVYRAWLVPSPLFSWTKEYFEKRLQRCYRCSTSTYLNWWKFGRSRHSTLGFLYIYEIFWFSNWDINPIYSEISILIFHYHFSDIGMLFSAEIRFQSSCGPRLRWTPFQTCPKAWHVLLYIHLQKTYLSGWG